MPHIRPDFHDLADFIAEQLLDQIDETLAGGAQAHIALTGGSIGIAALAAVARSGTAATIDWNAVHLWWGDERFLPEGDPDRNETQARDALINGLPIPAANVHPIPRQSASLATPEDAAAQYAAELQLVMGIGTQTPKFNIIMLGMGPDGHIASLFPGSSQLENVTDLVVAVHDSPKPPPTRVSLTVPILQAAEQIWLTVAGSDKASAVKSALDPQVTAESIPAAAVATLPQTTWFLDAEAAASL